VLASIAPCRIIHTAIRVDPIAFESTILCEAIVDAGVHAAVSVIIVAIRYVVFFITVSVSEPIANTLDCLACLIVFSKIILFSDIAEITFKWEFIRAIISIGLCLYDDVKHQAERYYLLKNVSDCAPCNSAHEIESSSMNSGYTLIILIAIYLHAFVNFK